MNNANLQNISNTDRVVRIIAGLGLVLSVTLVNGPLGLTAMLPLVAIYPIMTGVLGWDPIVKYIATFKQHTVKDDTRHIGHAV